MEDVKTMDLDLAAAMKLYGTLSTNVVEKSVAEQFTKEVKKAVARAQLLADGIINSLTGSRRIKPLEPGEVARKEQVYEETPGDVEAAKQKLLELASSIEPVVVHWKPFLVEIAAQLGIDLAHVDPREMVPDAEKMKQQLGAASAEILRLQGEVAEYERELGHAHQNEDDALKRLEQGAALVKDAQASLGGLIAERDALKRQLEAAKDPEAAYSRYNEQGPNPWKTYDGKDVPKWAELPEKKNGDQVQAKWRAAVGAVITPPPPPAA